MIIDPIIPIWLMAIICVGFLVMRRKGMWNFIRQILIVVLLFVINLRIMVPNGDMPTVMSGAEVLFVIDNTISMLAEDYNGDGRRLDAVKKDCTYIMEQLPGATFSVISFGNSVKTLIPYTIDTNNVRQAVASLNGQTSLYATGTSLNLVIDDMKEALDRDGDNCRIVFFISDGEITHDEKLKSFAKVSEFVDGGAVLGYGTKNGGKMHVAAFVGDDDEPEELYYYDENFDRKPALSKIDEKNLKSIAADLGVSYVHMTAQSDIDDELAKVKAQIEYSAGQKEIESTEGYGDIYFYFIIPLVALLVFDFIYYKKKIIF